jgi:hypothetical protein
VFACALTAFFAVTRTWATVATFDELSETASGAFFASQYQGYQGLTWNNILCNNAILATNFVASENLGITNGLTGNFYGMVSASNVVDLSTGSEIDSPGTNYNFLSAYLTGFLNSNLNVEVQGFSGATLLYDTTVVASATSPTLFTFNYLNIDRLYFHTFGGEPAFVPLSSDQAIMDNFDFEFVPEPSAFLLTAAGALMLWAVVKRRRG